RVRPRCRPGRLRHSLTSGAEHRRGGAAAAHRAAHHPRRAVVGQSRLRAEDAKLRRGRAGAHPSRRRREVGAGSARQRLTTTPRPATGRPSPIHHHEKGPPMPDNTRLTADLTVIKRDGSTAPYDGREIAASIEYACRGLYDSVTRTTQLLAEVEITLFDGITTAQLD